MQYYIRWTFFVEVNREEKCLRLLERISEEIGSDLEETKVERYWKIESLFRATAQSSFDASSADEAAGRVLVMANKLAHRWIVGGPHAGDLAREFRGQNDPGSLRISGIHSISFESTAVQESQRSAPAILPATGTVLSATALPQKP